MRALTAATLAVVTSTRGRPSDAQLRRALTSWAFNLGASSSGDPDTETAAAPSWLERNTRPIADLEQSAVARAVLDALTMTSTGKTAAPGTVQRLRGVVVNPAEYAVGRRLLARNPITSLTWKAPRTVQTVDRRVVVNRSRLGNCWTRSQWSSPAARVSSPSSVRCTTRRCGPACAAVSSRRAPTAVCGGRRG